MEPAPDKPEQELVVSGGKEGGVADKPKSGKSGEGKEKEDGEGSEVGDSPQFMPSPFGTKLVPVRQKSGSSKAVEVFKRPLAPPLESVVKKKRKVLSEDKFAESLEKIIQRDCFPELEKLKAQNAYLDAVANNDIQMMRELHAKYGVGRNTPSLRREANDTPSTFETPSSAILSSNRNPAETPGSVAGDKAGATGGDDDFDDAKSVTSETSTKSSSGRKEKKPHDLGLNEFLNTFTSEDDQSFQDIIDEGIRKHKIKHTWLYEKEDEHYKRMQLAITLPSMEMQALEYQRPPEVGTWTYKNKNALMYIPEGVPYTGEELAELARKKNEVDYKNTRFMKTPFKPSESATGDASSTPGSTSTVGQPMNLIAGMAEGKIGVDGKELKSGETPSIGGFKLVRTPSPNPDGGDTPFLTWGEIEGTPFRLDASDTPVSRTPGTPYRMIATSNRERLALELAEKVSQRHRDKKQKTIEVAKSYLASPSPRPKTSIERMNSMSPAAQRFAKNLLKKSEAGTPRTPRY